MTNIRSIVEQPQNFRTSDNAGWYDAWLFQYATDLASAPTIGNIGNGTIGAVSVNAVAPIAAYTVVVSDKVGLVAYYALQTRTGTVLAESPVDTPIQAYGLAFTLAQGAAPFAVGDSFGLRVLAAPLDITGVAFDGQARVPRVNIPKYLATPALSFSTAGDAPTLVNGGATGLLQLQVPLDTMAALRVTTLKPYDYDLIARADGDVVRARKGVITHETGITRLAA